jgi:hypothetical protein
MGYYSTYDVALRTENGEFLQSDDEQVKKVNALMQRNPFTDYNFKSLSDIGMNEHKWYEWEDDMMVLSRIFPDLIFEVSRRGESYDLDWEIVQFKGGDIIKREVGEVTFIDVTPTN